MLLSPPLPRGGAHAHASLPDEVHEAAARHQQATIQMLREAENDAVDFDVDAPAGLDADAWDHIRAHNDAVHDAECTVVPLDDLALGPGHVAKKFIDQSAVRFNDEQMDCMALLVWDLEQACRAQRNAEAEHPALPGTRSRGRPRGHAGHASRA